MLPLCFVNQLLLSLSFSPSLSMNNRRCNDQVARSLLARLTSVSQSSVSFIGLFAFPLFRSKQREHANYVISSETQLPNHPLTNSHTHTYTNHWHTICDTRAMAANGNTNSLHRTYHVCYQSINYPIKDLIWLAKTLQVGVAARQEAGSLEKVSLPIEQ